jgi:hypothetical protein
LHEFVAKISVPPGHAPLRVTALPDATGLRTGDRMLLAGLARVDGYAGLEPVKRLDYTSFAALQLAGVNWISEPATGEDAIGRRWVAVAPTAPRARLVAETTTSEHSNGLDAASLDPSTVQVIEDKPGRITLDVDAPLGQLLVTTESFDSGWQAAVDGQPRPIARVNGDFLGCAAPAGRHRVRFEFRPPALGVGGLMSVCGLELIMCVFCLRLRGQRGAT